MLYYAIADLAAFITPGDPVDVEAHQRGQTLYGADSRDPAAPDVDLRGRRLAAARPGPPRPALDDHHGRGERAHRRRGGAGAGEEPGPARLPGRAEAHRRRHRRRVLDAAQGGRGAPAQARAGPRRRLAAAARAGGRHGRVGVGADLPRPAAGRGVERADVAAHRLRRGVADDVRASGLPPHPAAAGPARRAAAAPHRARARHRVAGRAAVPRLHPRPRCGQAAARRDDLGLHPAAPRQRLRRLRRRDARPSRCTAPSTPSTPT